jgi:PKD repeat protein
MMDTTLGHEDCMTRSQERFAVSTVRGSTAVAARLALALTIFLGIGSPAAALAAGTFYVDTQHPSASDSNPGTEALPYKTITAAGSAHNGSGTTIIVKPGLYRETVTVPASGVAASRFVYQAYAPGVVIDGTDDFTGTPKWAAFSGNVYRASTVTWSPFQVFVDGNRLTPSAAAPGSLPLNSFTYVSGSGLYVNIGGDNPGAHATMVGHRQYGIRISAKTYVTLDGFHVTRTEDRGIYVQSAANNNIVRNMTVDWTYRYGIAINGCTGVLVERNKVSDSQDHGIGITASSTGCTIQDNESCRNSEPLVRAANGIYSNRSTGNLYQRNLLHHNQDTGLHLGSFSDNNISINNVSWNNGDHGFDHLNSANNIDVGNVAYGNFKDGFSIEGSSSGTRVFDCIAIENGLTTNEFDLWVDSESSVGFQSDYNIFWNSTSQQPVKYISTLYSSVAAYSAASGKDTHSIQADPKFVDALTADFELRASSPGIDRGNSSVTNWPATDVLGRARIDDPNTPNLGVGPPISYADIGAYEFQATGAVPVAALTVTPSSGSAPLSVSADASASTTPNEAIVSYRFDFGDGTIVGPQSSPIASHTYAAGTWTCTVTVVDMAELSSSTSRTVNSFASNQPPNALMDSPAGNLTIFAGQGVNFTATGVDPDNNLPLTFSWNFGGGAANNTLEDPGPTLFNTPGTYTVALTVTDGLGASDPTPDTRIITVNPAPTGTQADEIHWTFMGQTAVAFDWRGFDKTIRYGLTTAYGSTVTAATPTPIPFSSAGPFWEAQITGLQENTTYHYSIGTGPDHLFHTPPPRGSNAAFTVYVAGDIGAAANYSKITTLQNVIAAGNPAFGLMVGDLSYGNTNGLAAVDNHFNDMMAWSRDAAYMPAWGNHEYETPTVDDLRNYKGRFSLPNPQTSPGSPGVSCCGEDWYWFDYGNVRFIAYPEPHSGAWTQWRADAQVLMDQAQADPAIRFIVTFGHRPAWGSGFHGSETTIQNHLNALGDTHSKFVLNLNGHSHNYERTFPQHGVTFVTAGTGGSSLETVSGPCPWGGGCPAPAFTAFRALHHVNFKLTFTGTTIVGEAICGPADSDNDIACTQGTVIDSFVIGDRPPVVTAPATVSGNAGVPLTVSVTASDPDGNPITSLTASNLPSGASFSAAGDNLSGTMSWTPSGAQGGTYNVTFTASNALSGSASTIITITSPDHAPVVTAPATVSVSENQLISVTVSASDPEGDTITSLTATGSPSGASFTSAGNHQSGTFSWTPSFTQAGTYTVTFTAVNTLTGSANTIITVNNVDRAPSVSVAPTVSVNENQSLNLVATASDPDAEPIASFTASGLPSGATFTPAADKLSGTMAWVPSYTQHGTYPVTFTAANALSGSASTVVTVVDVDGPPQVSAPPAVSGKAETVITVAVTASDPEGTALTSLVATGVPSGATFSAGAGNTSGTLTWTPLASQVGTYSVTFTAANALSGSASTTVTVTPADRAPVVTAPATVSVFENQLLAVNVTASDPDGDAISSLTATGAPTGASFAAAPTNLSGTLSWTPTFTQSGSYPVTFTAANALSGSASTVITVNNADQAPVVSAPASVSGTENVLLTVAVTASDPDAEAIASLTATGPSGIDFTSAPDHLSGTLSWTPSYTQAGTHTVTFTASNAISGSASTTITVANVDRAPAVTAPATAIGNENTPMTVVVSAADPDGDTIASLGAAGLPAGALFSTGAANTAGTLSWTPTFTQAGTTTVTFTASNALSGSASTAITVNNVDRAPVVSAPATASGLANTLMTFTVSASDPDAESITSLTAPGAPSGSTFSAGAANTTGTFTWTPSSGDVGTRTVTFVASNALTGSASTVITIQSFNQPPVAALSVTPSTGNAPLLVTANATGSTDPDGTIASYLFNFGDGSTAGPQASPTATHSFAAGTWTVTVTVTDNNGGTNSRTASVLVAATGTQPNLVGNPSFETNINGWNVYSGGTLSRVAGGFDGSWALQSAAPSGQSSYGANDSPNWVLSVPAAGRRYRFTAWVRSASNVGTAKLQLREYQGSTKLGGLYSNGVVMSPNWQMVTVDYVSTAAGTTLDLQVINFPASSNEVFLTDNISIRDITTGSAPVVTAPATVTGTEGIAMAVNVLASDPDADPITSLTASGTPAGAVFTAGSGNTSGTLSWTPTFTQAGSYTVTFTASNALSGSAATAITVNNVDRAPVVTAPASASVNENALLTVTVTASDPDGEALASLSVTGTPVGGATFTANAGNTGGTLTWTPTFTQAGSYTATFTASNALSGSAATAITVNNVDRAPVVTAPASASVNENALLTVTVTAADPDGEALSSLTAAGTPTGATFTAAGDNTSGTLSWTPTFTQAGSYTVTFTASNALSGSAATAITVNNVDAAPVVTAPATASVTEGLLLTVNVTAADADGDAIATLSAGTLPEGASFTAGSGNTSGTLSWTPTMTQAGSYTVTFTVSNALSGTAATAITVIDAGSAPSVSAPATASVNENGLLTVNVSASDPDGDPITSLTASGAPSGATFTAAGDHASGTLTWTPSYSQAGAYTVTFTATNTLSGSASTAITVNNVDRGPVVTAPATASVNENQLLSVNVTASDPDAEAIASLTAAGVPSGATFTASGDHASGTLTWTPDYSQAGAYTVTFTASNALSGSASTAITVNNVDRAPVVTAPGNASVNENQLLTENVSAADPDGDAIASLTASGMPSGATFTSAGDHASGTLTWTPDYSQAGAYTVTFTATNAISGSASTAITVNNVDRAPVVTAPATASVNENQLLAVNVSASDPDAEAIASLIATGVPSGATFTAGAGNTSGTLSWTPGYSQAGAYTVTFTATNALSGSASTAITVNNVDRAPVVTAPATTSVVETELLTLSVTAVDPDGDAIASLTATGVPSGAAFTAAGNSQSGTLTWTPAIGQNGTYTVTFHAANALSGSASTVITVNHLSAAPVVSAPASASVPENQLLPVTVSASDADGDPIASLTASGVPSGATFSAGAGNTSGTLSWTPSYSQAGSYTVTFTASNTQSGSASTAITVTNVDRAPVVTAPASVSGSENNLLTFTVSAADPDGDAIAFLTATGVPSGATFSAGAGNLSGTLSWTPSNSQSGTYDVAFTASNALSGSAGTHITIVDTDLAPVVTAPATAAGNENTLITVTVSASDPDGQAITSLTAASSPATTGSTFTAGAGNTSGTFSWTPSFTQAGGYTVTFTASNALSGSASTLITVNNVDHAPTVTAPASVSGNEGTPITVTVTASDSDGEAIASLTASGAPAGATFTSAADRTSGTMSWTPTFAQAGSYSVTFTAANALSGTASTSITVNDVDRAPVVTAPATASGRVGTTITVTINASDPDGQAIASLTATTPAGASFSTGGGNTSGTLTWTPVQADVGSRSVTFTASNVLSGSAATVITVQPAIQAPTAVLTVTPSTGNATLSVTANGSGSSDPDGTIASYRFDFGDGTIVGPGPAATATHSYAAGSWTVTLTVTDNDGATGAATVPVTVAAVPPQANLVGNPSFETNANGWNAYSTATLLRVAGGFDGGFGLQVTGPAAVSSFGANDSPNWVLTTPAAGTTYRFTAWVRSVSHHGLAKLQVREYAGATKVGGLYSNGVALAPGWQLVTVDYVTVQSGTTLDFQVIDFPVVANEVFLTDNIAIRNVTGGSAAASLTSLDTGTSAPAVPLRGVLSPSPLRSQSVLEFATSRPGRLEVMLYDIQGRLVRRLSRESNAPAGLHRIPVDGRSDQGGLLASGVYFYRIQANEGASSGRFIVTR